MRNRRELPGWPQPLTQKLFSETAITPGPPPDPSSHCYVLFLVPRGSNVSIQPGVLERKKLKGLSLLFGKGFLNLAHKTRRRSGRRQTVAERQRTRLSISGIVSLAWSHVWNHLDKVHALSLILTML